MLRLALILVFPLCLLASAVAAIRMAWAIDGKLKLTEAQKASRFEVWPRKRQGKDGATALGALTPRTATSRSQACVRPRHRHRAHGGPKPSTHKGFGGNNTMRKLQ